MDLDHLFICVDDAPAAERALADFGMRSGVRPDILVLKQAAEHHLELEWDGGSADESRDFRPALPLTVRW